jgi:hypothetical protein
MIGEVSWESNIIIPLWARGYIFFWEPDGKLSHDFSYLDNQLAERGG